MVDQAQAAKNARAVFQVVPPTGVSAPALPAGENHIGAVAGEGTSVIVTPTVSTTAYAANDVVGGKLTLTNAVRVAGGMSILQSVKVFDRANQKAALQIVFFDADPAAAVLTNDAQVDLSTAGAHTDFPKICGLVNIAASDYTTIDNVGANDYAIAEITAIAKPLKSAATTSLWAAIITTGTPTYGNVAALSLRFGFLYAN